MTRPVLRVVIADDEGPARRFLTSLLAAMPDVRVVGDAGSGLEALEMIQRERPDLALLDLEMPELDGLAVARRLGHGPPLIAFVTAFDTYAARAFEVNAIAYLTKPVTEADLRDALERAHERLEEQEMREAPDESPERTEGAGARPYLTRIPIKHKGDIVLLPVSHLASVEAEGELLHLTTVRNDRLILTYRLKDLEAQLDPAKFIRLGRGILVSLDQIERIIPLGGGIYAATLRNGQQFEASRIQSRLVRERLLKL